MSSPKEWGPHMWGFIHTVCMINYNDIIKNKTILRNISKCLPFNCYCKTIYDQYLPEIDPMNTNKELYEWSIYLHNKVNEKLNKVIYTTADDEYKELDITDQKSEEYLWKYIHTMTKLNMTDKLPEFIILENNTFYLDRICKDLQNICLIILDNNFKEFYKEKLTQFLKTDKNDLIKRAYIYNWSINIHNERNTLLGKPLYIDN